MVPDRTPDERKRVYIALYQTHLPTLTEYGIIDYDKTRGTITPTPLIRVFDPYLDDGLYDATESLSIGETDKTDSRHSLADTLSNLFRG